MLSALKYCIDMREGWMLSPACEVVKHCSIQPLFSSIIKQEWDPVGHAYLGRTKLWSFAYSFTQVVGSFTAYGVNPNEMSDL